VDAAAPVMRGHLIPIFDEFRPDVVISERAEVAAAPIAEARGIPHVTVAFSGALPEWSEPQVIASLAPLWALEGLPTPTIDRINGDLYLHPFPPSFGQAPASGDVRPMRPVAVGDDAEVPPPWLDDLGNTRPLVYLTAGTERTAANAPWAAAAEALGARDVDVLATLGRHADPSLFGVVPPNIRIERFVPQQFVFDHAAIAMSHAGAGSTLGAAARGLPQVHFPMFADQWENADAAAGADLSITLETDQRSAGDIGDAIDRILGDQSFKQAALRVASEIAEMPSPSDHVGAIEALGNSRA
jgi:UDP:flavonoid glycosyltransferase YjiC (YdhE family)